MRGPMPTDDSSGRESRGRSQTDLPDGGFRAAAPRRWERPDGLSDRIVATVGGDTVPGL